jgi:hypothetical protein
MTTAHERTLTDSPDELSRGDRGTRQSRCWLSSEIPLGAFLEVKLGAVREAITTLSIIQIDAENSLSVGDDLGLVLMRPASPRAD